MQYQYHDHADDETNVLIKGFPLDLKNKISRTKCLLSTIMRKFWIMTETLFWLYAADELLRSEGFLESFSFFNGPKINIILIRCLKVFTVKGSKQKWETGYFSHLEVLFWIMTETLFWLYAADELLRSEGFLESFSFFNGPKINIILIRCLKVFTVKGSKQKWETGYFSHLEVLFSGMVFP